ncbi:CreA family protein [Methyloligella solikamskensis]|uniref:CreA family protein n=1 Tax=Methyloligella solikamskensis TaxID=1177756 RepID=A0ABW3J7Z3_9HYPH
MKRLGVAVAFCASLICTLLAAGHARADDLECVDTTWRFFSPDDKVCVSSFEDPDVPGVACFISQARKGGWGQPFGLNEDPSNFSVACRQLGPIDVDISKLPEREQAFTSKTSIFFKKTRIYRIPDVAHNSIVYLAVSSKIIDGSPANAVSVVPILPWPEADTAKDGKDNKPSPKAE